MGALPHNLEVGYGVAKNEGAFATGEEAAQKALTGIGSHPLCAVLVFASVCYDLNELLAGVRAAAGDVPIFGATTAGEICNGAYQNSAVVVALASSHMTVRIGLGQRVSEDWQRAVDEAVRDTEIHPYFSPDERDVWDRMAQHGQSAFAILFSPGNTRRADSRSYEILEELRRRSLGRMSFFGGSAADDWQMDTNYVFCGPKAYPDSLLVAVVETGLPFGIAMAHGFQPSGRCARVTRAEGHEVLELDGQPAAEVYARLLHVSRESLEGKHVTLATGRPLGVRDAYGQHTINVASYFTPRRGLRLAQPAAEGTVLTVMEPEVDDMVVAGEKALLKAMLRSEIADPAIALVFSCALRSRILKDRLGDELVSLREASPNLPVVGFYAFGEQGVTDDGVSRHNNETVAVLVLGRQLTCAARIAQENQRLRGELGSCTAEQNLVEAVQRRSSQRFVALFEEARDAMVVVDSVTGAIVDANAAAEKLTGRAKHQLTGLHFLQIHPPEERERHRAICAESVRSGAAATLVEGSVLTPSGQRIPVEINSSIVEFPDGRRVLQGVFRDITQRKQAEEALRTLEQEKEAILNGLKEVMVEYVDPQMRIIWSNAFMHETFVGSSEQIAGRHCYEVVRGRRSPCPGCTAVKACETGEYQCGEIVDPAGRTWLAHSNPIKDADDKVTGIVHVAIDITERKQAEENLRKKDERLRETQKLEAVGLLAGGIAHEFNNLLQAIGGYAHCALEGLSADEQRYRDIQHVLKAADRAAVLTRQLLGFSRRRDLQPRHIDLNEVVADLAKMLRSFIGEHIVVKLALRDDAVTVYGDPGELQQVLLNLCLNARDAMPSGGTLLLKTDAVTLSEPLWDPRFHVQPGRYAVLSVTDTGCGMLPEVQQRVFEPFFTTKEVGKGTGLGLSVVYGIVQQHQGAIHVYSEPGKGTTLKIYLPAVPAEADGPQAEEPAPAPGGCETILVAEDDPMVRNLAVRILEKQGYTVLAAADGREALRVFREHRSEVALVLLDTVMPKLDGHEVYRRIKADCPGAKVLFASGYDPETNRAMFIRRENLRLIEKPFDASTLLCAVREVLDEEGACQPASQTTV